MNSYTKLIDKHLGKNCIIIGAGPSLYDCMQHSLFSDLKKYGVIITVNSGIMAEPEPSFWVSCDHLCVNWSWWKDVIKSKCIKVVRNSWLKYKDNFNDFLYFKPRSTSEDKIDFEEEGLCYCNSFSASIDLAIQLGFSNIFLLGLDHQAVNGKHHFWQFFERNKQPRQVRPAQASFQQQRSLFPIHLQSYKALKVFADYRKVEIYNCNPCSDVNVFEKIKFKNILKIIKE